MYFGKKETLEDLARARTHRTKLKKVWSGHVVRDWAELGEYWMGVKVIMDAVRERLGGDEGILKTINADGEGHVKSIVLEIRDKLIGFEEGEDGRRRFTTFRA